jgi:hypothetical protein
MLALNPNLWVAFKFSQENSHTKFPNTPSGERLDQGLEVENGGTAGEEALTPFGRPLDSVRHDSLIIVSKSADSFHQVA